MYIVKIDIPCSLPNIMLAILEVVVRERERLVQ
jgi:hypothetical protein